MDFVVESLSPTRKKVTLTFSGDDVDKALGKAVNDYRKDLVLPGFRKGKVPTGVIERRFGEELCARSTQDTINTTISDVLGKEGIEPFSRIDLDTTKEFSRGESFTCDLSFDVLPAIDFPPYEGLAVEQTACDVNDSEMEDVLNRLRANMGELEDLTEVRPAQDGEVADVNFAGFENGEAVKDVLGEHFMLTLGEKQALDDFEALVKSLAPGEEKEGPVTFPAEYGQADLAGRTITMRVKVNSVKARKLPELDDSFAKKTGNESLEKLREAIKEHTLGNKKQMAKSTAMKKLLDSLMENVTFDLPETLLETRIQRVLADRASRLQRMGKSLDNPDKTQDELRAEAKAEAEESLHPQVFLMALAKKEQLAVSEQEVEMQIYSMAMRAGQDYRQISDAYHKSGMLFDLRDRLLADKAMELVYSKAVITEVAAPVANADAADGATA